MLCMHRGMRMQVVAFQAVMEMMAQQFPGAFSGYNLAVTESHQRTKADTSGTAKAVVGSLQKLGLDFSEVLKTHCASVCIQHPEHLLLPKPIVRLSTVQLKPVIL